MSNATLIKAELRNLTGSSCSRRLRREGILPAVVGEKDGKSVSIQLNKHEFDQMLHHHSGDSLIADLEISGEKSRKVLLVEVQRNGITGQTEHADFLEVAMDKKMHVPVPIELIGEPAGLQQGGVLDHGLREVEIEILPGDMIETIEVDVSALQIGDSIQVGDIPKNAKWTMLTDAEITVASLALPRVEEEPEDDAAEGAEPQVIGEKKAEG